MDEPLLPTPRSNADRASREALTKKGHWSAPSLAQAVELAQGQLPREYQSWDEVQGRSSASSPVSEDSTSPSNPSDGSVPARSRSTPGAQNSSPDTGRLFPVGEMPSPSTIASFEASISSAPDGRASRTPTPASGRARLTNGKAGPQSARLFARLDPDGSWVRTYRGSEPVRLDGTSEAFSGTWPSSGMTVGGRAYEHPTSVLPTDGNGSSSLPTPTARLGDQRGAQAKRYTNPARSNDLDDFVLTLLPTVHGMPTEGQPRNPGPTGNELGRAITRLMPTPTSNDVKNAGYMQSGGRKYPTLPGAVGGTGHFESPLATGTAGESDWPVTPPPHLGVPTDPPSEDGSE